MELTEIEDRLNDVLFELSCRQIGRAENDLNRLRDDIRNYLRDRA